MVNPIRSKHRVKVAGSRVTAWGGHTVILFPVERQAGDWQYKRGQRVIVTCGTEVESANWGLVNRQPEQPTSLDTHREESD